MGGCLSFLVMSGQEYTFNYGAVVRNRRPQINSIFTRNTYMATVSPNTPNTPAKYSYGRTADSKVARLASSFNGNACEAAAEAERPSANEYRRSSKRN